MLNVKTTVIRIIIHHLYWILLHDLPGPTLYHQTAKLVNVVEHLVAKDSDNSFELVETKQN